MAERDINGEIAALDATLKSIEAVCKQEFPIFGAIQKQRRKLRAHSQG